MKIGSVDKANARKILKQLEAEHAKEKPNLKQQKQIRFYDFVNEYLQYAGVNKARNTLMIDTKVCNQLKHEWGNILLDRINKQMIEVYKVTRVKTGMKPSAVNRFLAVISFMLNKAVDWGYLRDNPYKGIKMLKLAKQPARFLTVEEMQRLLDSASPWLKPMLIVLRNTGLRVHEMLNLKWADVDFGRLCITARSDKTRDYRVIPMTEELTQTLL